MQVNIPDHYTTKRRVFTVNNTSRLIDIINQATAINAQQQPSIRPATLRSELHRYAEFTAGQDRDYDTMILMAAAFILRDPNQALPEPTPYLPPNPIEPDDEPNTALPPSETEPSA